MRAHLNELNRSGFWERLPALWDSDTQEMLECIQIRQETHDVSSFIFRAPEHRAFVFRPGQFITLELDIGGSTINRCYTISSSPARPHNIAITVKRVPGGPGSNWLHAHLKVGDRLRVLAIAGEFSCADVAADKYLFLSAGSGITPLMAMTRAHYDLGDDRDIAFVHSARTPDDIIFERELGLMATAQHHFRPHFICEKRGQRADWPGLTGRLSLPALQLMVPDLLTREVFVCGPAPYMQAVRSMLEQAGFDFQHYHEERFSFDTPASAPKLSAAVASRADTPAAPAGFTVHFQKSQCDVRCGPEQSVLEAARAGGVRVASSCSQGMCGTCKVKLLSGQVEMQHKGGIRQREIDQGMVLLCGSKPRSDLVLEK